MKFHKDHTLPDPKLKAHLVFGSNRQGIHGKGAALVAKVHFDAEQGCWDGPCGLSYAIPTKYKPNKSMLLMEIQPYVDKFLDYARKNRGTMFWVTRVGCGHAGHTDEQIAPMFIGAPDNCSFAEEWRRYLCK